MQEQVLDWQEPLVNSKSSFRENEAEYIEAPTMDWQTEAVFSIQRRDDIDR